MKDEQENIEARERISSMMSDLSAAEAFAEIREHLQPKEWDTNEMMNVLTELEIILMTGLSTQSKGGFFTITSGSQLAKGHDIRELFEEWIVQELNKHRPTKGNWNKVVETFGMWVVCANGSIDYGPREFYSIPPDWHEDEYSVPHVMRKSWVKGYEMDLLVAFGASAKIQGIKSFTIGADIW